MPLPFLALGATQWLELDVVLKQEEGESAPAWEVEALSSLYLTADQEDAELNDFALFFSTPS